MQVHLCDSCSCVLFLYHQWRHTGNGAEKYGKWWQMYITITDYNGVTLTDTNSVQVKWVILNFEMLIDVHASYMLHQSFYILQHFDSGKFQAASAECRARRWWRQGQDKCRRQSPKSAQWCHGIAVRGPRLPMATASKDVKRVVFTPCSIHPCSKTRQQIKRKLSNEARCTRSC